MDDPCEISNNEDLQQTMQIIIVATRPRTINGTSNFIKLILLLQNSIL